MKKMITAISLLTLFLTACQSGQNENENAGTKETGSDTAKAAESIRTNMSYLNDFNALEALFSNDNWLLPDQKDSSYLYVSRINDFLVNTYAYRLEKGDSARVEYGHIKTDKNELIWNFQQRSLKLTSATRTRSTWMVAGSDSLRYEFIRLDNDHIRLTYPDKKEVILKKTIPFSLFLVRSRYDFANGTHYAFDTTQFNRKK